jgi:uncharacterized protein (DUF1499 family)
VNFLAYLVSLYLPLCGTTGAAGIQAPGIVDFAHLHLKGHSEFLVAPMGFSPQPGLASPVYDESPDTLFADIQDIAAMQPLTFPLDTEPKALQAAWVVRSKLFNFPDVVEIAVLPAPGARSTLILYAHALYGYSDYGVNHTHAIRWLKDLNMKVSK